MRNLLTANFARLWRSRLFWMFEAGIAAWGVIAYALLKINTENGYPFTNGNTYFFNDMTFVGITLACFTGFFIGTEYSDGTMRNKLAVGHDRKRVYLANLITVLCVGLLQLAAYKFAAFTAGTAMVGDAVWSALYRPAESFALAFLSVCTSAAVAVFVSMVVMDKPKAILINALLAVLLLAAGASALKGMMQTETINRFYIPETGEYKYEGEENMPEGTSFVAEEVPNPKYLSGAERTVYGWITATLPTSQGLLCALNTEIDEGAEFERFSAQNVAGSVTAVVLISACGIFIFRRRDLK